MIIKRWDTTANEGAGGWVEQYPKTTVDQVYTGDGAAQVFDTATDKIKPKYLPDAILGGLKFASTVEAADVNTGQEIIDLVNAQYQTYVGSITPTPSFKVLNGIYWVASSTAGVSFNLLNTEKLFATAHSTRYYCVSASAPGEEQTESPTGVSLESGDWVVITGFTGTGTEGDPFVVKLSVINNTYQVATSGAYGIAKYGGTTDAGNRNYAATITSGNVFVNVPWTDTDTVYTHPTITYADAAGTETTLTDITLIDSITADNGHITNSTHRKLVAGTNVSITAASDGGITIASTDTNTTYTAGNGISLTGTEFAVAAGIGLTQEASGLKMTQPFVASAAAPASGYQVANNLWFDF
jgi:hypothetical protein